MAVGLDRRARDPRGAHRRDRAAPRPLPGVARLAWLAGGLSVSAAAASVAAIWSDGPGSTAGKVIAVLWILTGVAYLLVPVLQRFTSAGVPETAERVLAELNGIELVATRSRAGTLDVSLEPGERLMLRPRP